MVQNTDCLCDVESILLLFAVSNCSVCQQFGNKRLAIMCLGEMGVYSTMVSVSCHSSSEGCCSEANVSHIAVLACTDRTFEMVDYIGLLC